MIEPTFLNVVNAITVILMVFFGGLSIEKSEKTREIAGVLYKIFLVITMIFIFARQKV